MTDWKLPWTGRCRCERIQMRVTEPPLITIACHCIGCQRMTASAFSLSIALPATGFEVTQGEPELGGLHGEIPHYHCGYCKSWLFTRLNDMGMVNLRAPMLDEHSWFVPFVETCKAEALTWAQTGAKHSFPNIPDMPVWGPLVAEFALSGARPA